MRSRPLYDIAALLARLGVGIVFLAHGWQKIQVGITATSDSFDELGVPAPTASAIYATFTELLGGLALIAGLGLPVAGTLLFLDMAGAFVFVHASEGLFLVDQGRVRNGFELVLVLGLASLMFAAGGGGRLTLDRRLFPRRTERQRYEEDELWPPPEDPMAPGPPPDEPESPSATGLPAPGRTATGRKSRTASGGTGRTGEAGAALSRTAGARAADTTRPDIPARPTLRKDGEGHGDPAGPTVSTETAEPAEAEAKPKRRMFRRKAKDAEEQAPPAQAAPEDVPEETAPARNEAEPPGEPSPSAPRLAADIIGDTGQDVRVAGKRTPTEP